jgi:uncharacterized membrane protein YqhA
MAGQEGTVERDQGTTGGETSPRQGSWPPPHTDEGELGHLLAILERTLWSSRLLMLPAVVVSVLLATGAFFMATIDAVYALLRLRTYINPALSTDGRAELRTGVITGIVKALDGYLIAAILLIVALGLYELFISRLDDAARSEVAPRLLQLRDLNDLKDRIARLVLLVLIIEFFQRALRLDYAPLSWLVGTSVRA